MEECARSPAGGEAMPISFENLQYTIYRADHANAVQSAQLANERAGLAAAAVTSQDQGKAQAATQVQTSNRAEMDPSGGGGGGAMAMAQQGAGEEEQKPPQKHAPDPTGKGHLIDVSA